MTAMIRALPTLLCCGLILAASASHARAQDAALDRVQNLAATGRFTEARNTLEQWERSFADPRSNATPSDRARALYLRGVLSTDPKEAEEAFLAVALSYPSSSSAPGALLRLGQGLLASGEANRAVTYLERLRADYPGSPHRETGWLWLARAHMAAGSPVAACAAAREGITQASSANLVTLLELERDNTCAVQREAPFPTTQVAVDPDPNEPQRPAARPQTAAPAAPAAPAPAAARDEPPATRASAPAAAPAPAAPAPATPTPATPTPATPTPATPTPAARRDAPPAAAQFAVQAGAFRERTAAESIARELRAQGFDARVVVVDGSPLHRVRSGAFTTREQAMTAARRIINAGFEALIVSDVRTER
jgi:cell division septation protein DedD